MVPGGGTRARAAPLLLLLLAAACCCPCPSAAAPPFEPAKWNQHTNYSAVGIPYKLLFPAPPDPNASDDAGAPTPLFPIKPRAGQSELERYCAGPDRGFDSAADETKPGACWYGLTGAGIYTFWQKLPGDIMRRTNCYCYAVDRPGTDGWCLPGLGSGLGEPDQLTCDDLSKRIVADGAVSVTKAEALSGAVPAGVSHYMVLRLRGPDWCRSAEGMQMRGCAPDFHLLRQDSSSLWSHKIGSLPATDRDALGRTIVDPSPETAPVQGGFDQLCGFFRAARSDMHVGTQWTEDEVFRALASWRKAGLSTAAAPLPYDPAVDGVVRASGDEVLGALG